MERARNWTKLCKIVVSGLWKLTEVKQETEQHPFLSGRELSLSVRG